MTVSYTAEVATCRGLGCFLKLLFRWRGSIYKLVWPDLALYLSLYFLLSIIYRYVLSRGDQEIFEQVALYCAKYGNLIPISFVLGFYVSIVVSRWWNQYRAIPWPDSVAVLVTSSIQGQDEKGRLMRRTIMRYVVLALTMVFTLISPRVKKRFPTWGHFVEAGLMLENEKEILEEINRNLPGYSKHSIPIVWAASIVTRARKEKKIKDDFAVKAILDELNKFRSRCGLLNSYDRISVPLVYTQVVTLAVYSYFLSCIMGRQWLKPERAIPVRGEGEKGDLDLYFPFFSTLEFFFYMGWLKVAETLVNPFGDDDDDFEVSWMVDRNLQMSYMIVDEMHNYHPNLIKDQYWEEVFPMELPHTVASDNYREEVPLPSTANVEVSKAQQEIVSRRGSATTLDMQSIHSVNTKTGSAKSLLKRVLSRGKDLGQGGGNGVPELTGIASSMTLQHNVVEDVIPEMDENLATIVKTSADENKRLPSVNEVFENLNGKGVDQQSGQK